MATTKEREARSILELSRNRGRVRLSGSRALRPPGRRAGQTSQARAEFVKRVRSYLEVPRG